MKINIKFSIFITALSCIFIMYFSYLTVSAEPAETPETSTTAGATEEDFKASTFQKNIADNIKKIEETNQQYLEDKETNDINFGLHIVNFQGDVIADPKIQFLKDYLRISCNKTYENKITDCASATNNVLYGHLRSTNIFDFKQNQAELYLAETVARTIINPFPDSKLNELFDDKNSFDDPAKQQIAANLIASQAPLVLAENTFNEIIAKRNPLQLKDQEASMMQLIHDESVRRLSNSWIEDIKKLPLKHLILELLQIEAFKIWMEYNKYTQNERIEALLAAILAAQSNSMQKLNATIEKVNNSNKEMKADAEKKLPASVNMNDLNLNK